jgi:hypothetical protein
MGLLGWGAWLSGLNLEGRYRLLESIDLSCVRLSFAVLVRELLVPQQLRE